MRTYDKNRIFPTIKDYESNGRPSNRFLSGYHHDMGNYDLCFQIEPPNFRNQFCLVSIKSPYLDNVRKEPKYITAAQLSRTMSNFMVDFSYGTVLGFCLPSNCDINNLTQSINKVLQKYELEAIPQKVCSTNQLRTSRSFYISL